MHCHIAFFGVCVLSIQMTCEADTFEDRMREARQREEEVQRWPQWFTCPWESKDIHAVVEAFGIL